MPTDESPEKDIETPVKKMKTKTAAKRRTMPTGKDANPKVDDEVTPEKMRKTGGKQRTTPLKIGKQGNGWKVCLQRVELNDERRTATAPKVTNEERPVCSSQKSVSSSSKSSSSKKKGVDSPASRSPVLSWVTCAGGMAICAALTPRLESVFDESPEFPHHMEKYENLKH